MIFQRIATAVREAYATRDDVEAQLAGARAAHAWAEGLAVDPTTRAGLLEPIMAVEDGLREILRRRAMVTAEGSAWAASANDPEFRAEAEDVERAWSSADAETWPR